MSTMESVAGGDGVLPMFPLGAVLLPGEVLPLQVFEPRYRDMLDHCLATSDRMRFGVTLISRGHEVGGGDERTSVGTVARITSCRPIPGGRLLVVCVGEHRIRVDEWLADDPYPRARVRRWPDEPGSVDVVDLDALAHRLDDLRDLAAAGGMSALQVPEWSDLSGDHGDRAFAVARSLPFGALDRLRVLSAPDAATRVQAMTTGLDDVLASMRFRLADPD